MIRPKCRNRAVTWDVGGFPGRTHEPLRRLQTVSPSRSAIRPVLEGGHIHDDFTSFHEDSESVETTRRRPTDMPAHAVVLFPVTRVEKDHLRRQFPSGVWRKLRCKADSAPFVWIACIQGQEAYSGIVHQEDRNVDDLRTGVLGHHRDITGHLRLDIERRDRADREIVELSYDYVGTIGPGPPYGKHRAHRHDNNRRNYENSDPFHPDPFYGARRSVNSAWGRCPYALTGPCRTHDTHRSARADRFGSSLNSLDAQRSPQRGSHTARRAKGCWEATQPTRRALGAARQAELYRLRSDSVLTVFADPKTQRLIEVQMASQREDSRLVPYAEVQRLTEQLHQAGERAAASEAESKQLAERIAEAHLEARTERLKHDELMREITDLRVEAERTKGALGWMGRRRLRRQGEDK